MFTDTHCHLFNEYYEDLDEVVKISKNNGVNRFICAGCNNKSNIEVINYSLKYDNFYAAIGIHPEEISDNFISDVNMLEDLIKNNNILAIGEIGLDYYYSKSNKDNQIKLFELQLQLAEKYNLPVIVHSRDAIADTYNCIKKYNVKGIIHSFSGSAEMAKLFIELGFCLGINGVITFKNCNLKDVYSKIGLSNIVLETDSPYLTPEPYRGRKNDPSHILDIVNFITNYYKISSDELLNITNINIKRIFDI